MTVFSLEAVGGPWARRMASRRGVLDELTWSQIAAEASAALVAGARQVWTRSAFSEYASAAAFAEIASSLLAAQAPIDLVAAAGEFVADEMLHAELASRVAMALGGAVPLEVDLSRLVRPAEAPGPLLRAAELIVRTCCVGETLTVPVLNQSRRAAGSSTISAVITRILRDEAHHASLGWWFLEWAELTDADRLHLGRVAGGALGALSQVFAEDCALESGLGTLDCGRFDDTFVSAVSRSVVAPLAEHGIVVPAEDLEPIHRAAGLSAGSSAP